MYCSVAELGSTRLSVDPVQELLLVSRVGLELEDVCREGFGEGLLGTARSVGSKEASIERAPLLAGGGCFCLFVAVAKVAVYDLGSHGEVDGSVFTHTIFAAVDGCTR